jgi:hypothetical protein
MVPYRLFMSEVKMIGPVHDLETTARFSDHSLQRGQGAELIPVATDDKAASSREM